jgi:dihydrofolate reductase
MAKSVYVITAIQSIDNGIGIKGDQPYSFKQDFAHFQELTIGGSVIMGRRTWEAIDKRFRPLKERLNIVVTRDAKYPLPEGVLRASSYEEAKELARKHNPDGQIWNIGGGQLYEQALNDPETKTLFITRIEGAQECDTFFSERYREKFQKKEESPVIHSENRFDKKTYSFVFEKWERV